MIGGIGSGKSLSVVRRVVESGDNYPLTNFRLKKIKYHRLKLSDIIKTKDGKSAVNWDFWEKVRTTHKAYSIYLDEAHNIIGSRSSMSKQNQLMSRWISQIRKILSDSKDNHIYVITQKPRRIDVNFRELAQVVIECQKITKGKDVYIIQRFYNGFDDYELAKSGLKKASAKSFFKGNKYFKYYDTGEMVTFKDGEEYL